MGEVLTRLNRRTGTLIALVDNRDGSFDAFGPLDSAETRRDMSWATVCEVHGQYCLHRTRQTAESFMAAPDEWCSDCADSLS